jgi:hypothetical protein
MNRSANLNKTKNNGVKADGTQKKNEDAREIFLLRMSFFLLKTGFCRRLNRFLSRFAFLNDIFFVSPPYLKLLNNQVNSQRLVKSGEKVLKEVCDLNIFV